MMELEGPGTDAALTIRMGDSRAMRLSREECVELLDMLVGDPQYLSVRYDAKALQTLRNDLIEACAHRAQYSGASIRAAKAIRGMLR